MIWRHEYWALSRDKVNYYSLVISSRKSCLQFIHNTPCNPTWLQSYNPNKLAL